MNMCNIFLSKLFLCDCVIQRIMCGMIWQITRITIHNIQYRSIIRIIRKDSINLGSDNVDKCYASECSYAKAGNSQLPVCYWMFCQHRVVIFQALHPWLHCSTGICHKLWRMRVVGLMDLPVNTSKTTRTSALKSSGTRYGLQTVCSLLQYYDKILKIVMVHGCSQLSPLTKSFTILKFKVSYHKMWDDSTNARNGTLDWKICWTLCFTQSRI